jgi:hypothetical protein
MLRRLGFLGSLLLGLLSAQAVAKDKKGGPSVEILPSTSLHSTTSISRIAMSSSSPSRIKARATLSDQTMLE